MTSPGSKAEMEARLQRNLNQYVTAELDPRAKIHHVIAVTKTIRLRGRKKLVERLGIQRVERIESKAQAHAFDRWIKLRKGLGLSRPSSSDLKQIPKDIREQAGIQIYAEKQKILFVRSKLGVARTKDSDQRGQLHYRSLKTGRFVSQPHRKRSR